MAIGRLKHQVLNAIIPPVMILVMDRFPAMQATAYVLCHDKPMFKNIVSVIRHWVKEVSGMETYRAITLAVVTNATCPSNRTLDSVAATRAKPLSWFLFDPSDPSLLPAILTGVPDVFGVAMPSLANFPCPSNFPY